jgi:hypothetical protein
MNLLQSITASPLQQQTVALDDGTTFSFTLNFVPMQYGWFINSLSYGDFIINGLRIVNHPNFLYQWQNLIPFGMACFSTANREPQHEDDFASGASQLFILSKGDCLLYSKYITTGALPLD